MQNDAVTEHQPPATMTAEQSDAAGGNGAHTDRDPGYALADECESTARQAMTARDFRNAQIHLER
jgi:hypothetical protein